MRKMFCIAFLIVAAACNRDSADSRDMTDTGATSGTIATAPSSPAETGTIVPADTATTTPRPTGTTVTNVPPTTSAAAPPSARKTTTAAPAPVTTTTPASAPVTTTTPPSAPVTTTTATTIATTATHAPPADAAPAPTSEIAAGQPIFKQRCAGCHGADGRKTIKSVTLASQATQSKSESDLIRRFREKHKQFASMNDDQVTAVVSYVKTLQ